MKNASLTSYVTVIAAIFLTEALIYMGLYYYAFGIPIYTFIELTEVLVAFSGTLIPMVVDLVVPFVVILLIENRSRENENYEEVSEHLPEGEKSERIIRRLEAKRPFKFRRRTLLLFYLLISMFVSFIGALASKQTGWDMFLYILYGTSILVFLFVVLIQYLSLEKKKNVPQYIREIVGLIAITTVCTLITLFFCSIEISNVKKDYSTYGVSVQMNDGTKLKSDSVNIYVGKTKNFVFFFNKIDKQATVYPSGDVKTITLRKKLN